MPDTNSTYLAMLLMGDGLHSTTWGDLTNTNLSVIDTAIAGLTSVTTTGGTTTLNTAQAQAPTISVAGALASDAIVVVPGGAGGSGRVRAFVNATTGAFAVTIQSGSATDVVPQGQVALIYADGTICVNPSKQAAGNFVPIGTVLDFAGPSAPQNFSICDGSALSRTNFAALYATISTAFGAGDGVTTFNIPDLRGRVRAGPDAGTARLNSWALGAAGGEAAHILITAELAAHAHGTTESAHSHGITEPNGGQGHKHAGRSFNSGLGSGIVGSLGGYTALPSDLTDFATTGITINGATTGLTVNSAGSGTAHNNVQPTLVMTPIIRVQ